MVENKKIVKVYCDSESFCDSFNSELATWFRKRGIRISRIDQEQDNRDAPDYRLDQLLIAIHTYTQTGLDLNHHGKPEHY